MSRVTIICGGPSGERGISLNSARSLYDHLDRLCEERSILYVDPHEAFYQLADTQLYSNTPEDFDFKLKRDTQPLTAGELAAVLRGSEIVFPCVHGAFGEDGRLQKLLEDLGVPFVGSSSASCKLASNKLAVNRRLGEAGFPTLRMMGVNRNEREDDWKPRVRSFVDDAPGQHCVVKPRSGGSSLGVSVIKGDGAVAPSAEAVAAIEALFEEQYEDAVVEHFCPGREFAVVVLNGPDGAPVALPPTEVTIDVSTDKPTNRHYTHRRKYLPTADTRRHCPPLTFSPATTRTICERAEQVVALFGMRDLARFDGWVLDNGDIVFTDLNPISGLEQNSFFFQQGSRVGFTHAELLRHILNGARRRAGLPELVPPKPLANGRPRQPVMVLFGGETAERQVSVMSGTNVYFKLKQSERYEPTAYLLGMQHATEGDEPGDVLKFGDVWRLPFPYCLDHTVEEIEENCANAEKRGAEAVRLGRAARGRLLGVADRFDWQLPCRLSAEMFFAEAAASGTRVFLGLHGGAGEDGTIQAALDAHGVPYNGSGPAASKLCMDKLATCRAIEGENLPGLTATPSYPLAFSYEESRTSDEIAKEWDKARALAGAELLLIKPQRDGCSMGIAKLVSREMLAHYLELLHRRELVGEFEGHEGVVEMAFPADEGLLLQPFIATDRLTIDWEAGKLNREREGGWIELTVGVLEQRGAPQAMTPTITLKNKTVLEIEEKFQGGTGVNLTPPVESIVSPRQVGVIRQQVTRVSRHLGIRGYARIDIFFNADTDEVMVIEANTLPGMTASTVIFHQALAETPPLRPIAFIEAIIGSAQADRNRGGGPE